VAKTIVNSVLDKEKKRNFLSCDNSSLSELTAKRFLHNCRHSLYVRRSSDCSSSQNIDRFSNFFHCVEIRAEKYSADVVVCHVLEADALALSSASFDGALGLRRGTERERITVLSLSAGLNCSLCGPALPSRDR